MRWLVALAVIASLQLSCVGRTFEAARALPAPDVGLQASYLAQAPAAYGVRIDCLDFDGDGHLTASDLNPSRVPDLNLDGTVDAADVGALGALNMPLKPKVCLGGQVQFMVTPARPSPPGCDGTPLAVVVGISGATSGQGLENGAVGAGVRAIVDDVLAKLTSMGWQSAAVLATPDVAGATNVHTAAESWLEAALAAIVGHYPCARLTIIGHSYGGAMATAVSAALERGGIANVRFVGLLDRVTSAYGGDATSLPTGPRIFNVYQENEKPHSGIPNGAPLGAVVANASDWDVSRLKSPPLLHTTIDGDPDVQACLAAAAVAALEGAAPPDCNT